MSSTDQHTAIVRECFVYATKGDRAELERILSPDFVIHVPEEHRGVDGLLEIVEIAQTMNRRKPRHDLIRILRGHTPDIRDTG